MYGALAPESNMHRFQKSISIIPICSIITADPSSTVQYVRPNQTFPTAALIDYVSNKGPRSTQVARRVSFLVADSFNPTPEDDSTGNYFGAAADDCVDLKAANYILQKRLSLQDDYE